MRLSFFCFFYFTVRGFFRSIALGQRGHHHSGVGSSSGGGGGGGSGTMLQDVLRLLTLWFTWGHREVVQIELRKGFPSVDISTWQLVIPQLIVRFQKFEKMKML